MSLIEKIALKPCPNPWCASHDRRDAEIFELHKPIPMDHADHPDKWVVACPVCPINGPARDSRDEAIAAWNNRAALTAIMGEGDGVQECDREAVDCARAWCDDMDEPEMVQAFARHRTLAAAAERARVISTMREWLKNYRDEADHWPVIDDIGDLLTAIEAGEV